MRRFFPMIVLPTLISRYTFNPRAGESSRQIRRDQIRGLPGAALRQPRVEGVPRDQRRQDDHRQEPPHRRLLRVRADNKAFAIECKFQDSEGTVDEKIPYALDDLQALPMAGCIAYAGTGFSEGVRYMPSVAARRALPAAAWAVGSDERHTRARSPARTYLRLVGCARRRQDAGGNPEASRTQDCNPEASGVGDRFGAQR